MSECLFFFARSIAAFLLKQWTNSSCPRFVVNVKHFWNRSLVLFLLYHFFFQDDEDRSSEDSDYAYLNDCPVL